MTEKEIYNALMEDLELAYDRAVDRAKECGLDRDATGQMVRGCLSEASEDVVVSLHRCYGVGGE